MLRRFLYIFSVLSVLGLLFVLYMETHVNYSHSYRQVVDTIRDLRRAEAEMNNDALQVRYGFLLHYDTLKKSHDQLNSLTEALMGNEFLLIHDPNAISSVPLNELRRISEEKLTLLEKFKSHNAIVRNSLQYLPVLSERLVNELINRNVNVADVVPIAELLGQILNLSVTSEESLHRDVRERIEWLIENRSRYPKEQQDMLGDLLLHSQLVIDKKKSTDFLLKQLIAVSVSEQLIDLSETFDGLHQIKVDEVKRYQSSLYFLSGLLLLSVAYVIVRLRHNTRALKRSVDDLHYQKFAMDQHAIVCIFDTDGRVFYVNDRFVAISQYSREELLGQSYDTITTGPDSDVLFHEMWTSISQGNVWSGQLRHRQKSGDCSWVNATIVPFMDEKGRPYQYVSISSDISEHKLMEEALFTEKERAEVTLQSIADGVITTGAQGLVEYVNPMAQRLLGLSVDELQNQPLAQVLNVYDSITGELIPNYLDSSLAGGGSTKPRNVVLKHKDGREYSVEMVISPLLDRQGKNLGTVSVVHDVTAMRALAKQMSYQATHDALTGLVNRREFERRLSLLLQGAQEHKTKHALCYLDLDQFKVVNDTCGHVAGDELLRQLSVILQGYIRDRDTLARLGGDEFGILLGECPLDKAKDIADTICKAVNEFRYVWEDKTFSVGVSIGLVEVSDQSESVSNLTSAADTACYSAKDNGRNRVHVYQSDDAELQARHGEMQWVPRIEQALEQGRFVLYCQPILSLKHNDESSRHYEVLIRMRAEDGTLIPPGAFISSAERYDIMPAIDRWVVAEALSLYNQALQRNPAFAGDRCSINLSGASLCDEKTLAFIHQQLDKYAIPDGSICFEITETAAVANLGQAIRLINDLKKRGCFFSLDDFGSGMSSFAYLKNLPVDYLKIDGSFVQDIVTDPIDFAMVRAINEIGHVMGLETIAEYVSGDDICEKLRELGVDYGQGYGLAFPVPMAEYVLQDP